MTRRPAKDLLVPAALLLAGLLALAPTEGALRSSRATMPAAEVGTPWVRYVMVGLAGFRGVVSEILWLRADRLQHQGRYFELVQLSDWINALDPRATEAWVFNAWNLSYNVSAMLPDPAARLSWVDAGISLLRDRAIPANPSSPQLYRELGWLYQNKIGGSGDAAHLAYKLELARENTPMALPRPSARLSTTLEPDVVADLERRFGTLDWRVPNTHALYWAWKGLALQPTGFQREALRRMVQQNLAELTLAGRFTGDLSRDQYRTEPNFDVLPGLYAFFEETVREAPEELRIYCIFLSTIVHRASRAGRDDDARLAYDRLAKLLPRLDDPPPLPSFQSLAEGHQIHGL